MNVVIIFPSGNIANQMAVQNIKTHRIALFHSIGYISACLGEVA